MTGLKPKFVEMYEKGEKNSDSHAGLYSSNESAARRFRALADMLVLIMGRLDLTHKEVTVLDVGCGYGDLSGFLPPNVKYSGLEPVDWIYKKAAAECNGDIFHNDLHTFAAAQAEPRFDFVVTLGTMATVAKDELDVFASDLCKLAKRGVFVSYLREGEYKTDEGFSSWTPDEVATGFRYPVYRENVVMPEGGITTFVYFPVDGK